MRAVLDILRFDLAARIRDRSALVMAFVVPLALMTVFTMAFAGADNLKWRVGYVKAKTQTPIDAALLNGPIAKLREQKLVKLTEFRTPAAAKKAVADDDADVAVAVEARDAAQALRPTVTIFHAGNHRIAAMVATSIVDAVARRIGSIGEVIGAERVLAAGGDLRKAATTKADPEQTRRDATEIGRELAALPPPSTFSDDSLKIKALDPKTIVSAGMMTFFLLFTVQFGLLSLLAERRTGTLARILAAPVAPWQLLLAKLLVSVVLGVVSMIVLSLCAIYLLGAHFGPATGVLILIVCGVLAATAICSLVVGMARSAEQAGMAQSLVAMALGILGGSFVSMTRTGGFAAQATKLTPHYWFSEGLARINETGWTGALTPAAVLLGMTALVGIPGVLLAHRAVRP